MSQTYIHKLSNGITLIGEEMDFVSSAAFSILVPAGAVSDPQGEDGTTSILVEMFNKGAGIWNSKELSQQFEDLGVERHQSGGLEVSVFSGAMLGENLGKTLEIYSKVLLEPHLPADELESVRSLAIQELKSLEDEPSSKAMVVLAEKFYPYPFGRCQMGTLAGVKAINIDSLKKYFASQFLPDRAIIAVVGNFQWERVKQQVEDNFSAWKGTKPILEVPPLSKQSSMHHLHRDTSQLHIALGYPSVAYDHPDYYAARLAVGVLSGGMAGRLFVEVREKRGLVYHVSASHSAARGRSAVFSIAGTTPENGQKTLDVMLEVLQNLKGTIQEEELDRAKVDLKCKLVMQGESTSARAGAIVNDWWNLKRVRSLEEIKSAIGHVSLDDINRYLSSYPVNPVTLVTLGPKKLEFPC